MRNKSAVQALNLLASVLLSTIVSVTFCPLISQAAATPGLESEPYSSETLELLCEREDGDAYLAVFLNKTTGVYNVQTSGGLELGRTEVILGTDEMTVLSETLRIPIVIPRGRHEVAIDGSVFNCDY